MGVHLTPYNFERPMSLSRAFEHVLFCSGSIRYIVVVMAAVKTYDLSREGKDLRIRMQAGDIIVTRRSRAFKNQQHPRSFQPRPQNYS